MKQAYSRYGMVFAFLCVVGGGAYAGGPITYPARTDTCETSNTGPCLNLGMKFLGRPGDPLPTGLQLGLTRSNAVGMDVDFHDKVIRATDATDRNNASIEAEIGTHHWEKDSKMFIVRINNGGYLLRYFNPSLRTVQTSRIISATSGAGDSTHFGRAVSLTFSWTNSGTVYELYGTKINQLTIDQVSDTITSRVLVFDFAHDSFNSGVNCLPSTYVPTWNGLFDVSQDDKSFTVAFYNGAGSGQNNAHDLVNFTSGMGCRYMRTDTFQVVNRDWGLAAGPVMTDQPFVNGNNVFASRCSAAAPCPLYDSFGMHEAAQRHNKQFASFAGDVCSSVAPNYCSCPPTSSNAQLPCQKYYWEIATNFVRPCNNVTDCEGHAAGGSQLDFIGLGGVSHSFSQPNVGVLDSNGVNKGNPGLRTILIAPPVDNHGTYANADSTDQQPFIYTTSGVPSNPFVLNPVPPFTSGYLTAYYNELIGTRPNGSGLTYRFGHNFNTGDNPAYEAQSAAADISPNGLWLMFTSDMMGKLGDTTGAATCLHDLRADSIWLKSTALPLGYQVFSLSNDDVFKATVAGTTGTAQPNWVTCAANGSCSDGTVTWTLSGQNSCRADVFIVDLNSAH